MADYLSSLQNLTIKKKKIFPIKTTVRLYIISKKKLIDIENK